MRNYHEHHRPTDISLSILGNSEFGYHTSMLPNEQQLDAGGIYRDYFLMITGSCIPMRASKSGTQMRAGSSPAVFVPAYETFLLDLQADRRRDHCPDADILHLAIFDHLLEVTAGNGLDLPAFNPQWCVARFPLNALSETRDEADADLIHLVGAFADGDDLDTG